MRRIILPLAAVLLASYIALQMPSPLQQPVDGAYVLGLPFRCGVTYFDTRLQPMPPVATTGATSLGGRLV